MTTQTLSTLVAEALTRPGAKPALSTLVADALTRPDARPVLSTLAVEVLTPVATVMAAERPRRTQFYRFA